MNVITMALMGYAVAVTVYGAITSSGQTLALSAMEVPPAPLFADQSCRSASRSLACSASAYAAKRSGGTGHEK